MSGIIRLLGIRSKKRFEGEVVWVLATWRKPYFFAIRMSRANSSSDGDWYCGCRPTSTGIP